MERSESSSLYIGCFIPRCFPPLSQPPKTAFEKASNFLEPYKAQELSLNMSDPREQEQERPISPFTLVWLDDRVLTILQNGYMNSAAEYAYPSSYAIGNARNDWLESPVLDFPDWPADNQLNDPYSTSPVSSPGERKSWNYFDDNPKEAVQQSSLTSPTAEISGTSTFSNAQSVSQSGWNPNWGQSNSQSANISHVPLSLIHDPLAYGNENGIYEPEDPVSPSIPSTAFKSGGFTQLALKEAWGSSKESKRHSASSKSGRRSSQVKDKDKQSPRKSSTSSNSKGHQLRSSRGGHKIKYSGKEDTTNTESAKVSRNCHNMVEKHYRTRLNGQFSTLLDALPPDVVGAEIEGYARGDSNAEKKVSKAEVLMLAKRHIESLERENASLSGDNKVLEGDMQHLKGAWVRMGGQIFP